MLFGSQVLIILLLVGHLYQSCLSPLLVRGVPIANEVSEEKVKECTEGGLFKECLEEQLLGVAILATEIFNDIRLVIICFFRRLELEGFEDWEDDAREGLN